MTSNAKALLWTLVPALALDLYTKHLVATRFELYESIPLIPGFALTYVRNTGAAFSLFATFPDWFRRPFFLAVTVFAFWALRQYFKSLPPADRLSASALGLVAAGALGNFHDRLRFGEVVDFIEVGVREVYTWPVFNIADSAIFVGVGFLLYRAWRPLKTADASHPS